MVGSCLKRELCEFININNLNANTYMIDRRSTQNQKLIFLRILYSLLENFDV